ncbi:SDR family NAD(P)-dependent oxidoreductase [Mucilaginibacter gotjawali]|uniref:Butyryl-CoA dehydrogenase n=2 Tax=Mucilaginibacter gotjawali TaxID=1550579 RepID=A0A839SLG3_9SPHI|nr:SDR family oxidoreductase [Mucilaginibacter gotjawali]MBB3057690.1 butyryl-CoA dehydrogenase [Mucilaginibacter gotjawali]BAU52493.1 putative oxidoreductase SadH [Mucilaginibacter gotjawali]
MKNFENKVVVITGAGSGIGRALALAFQKAGAKLALNDNNEIALLETVALAGGPQNIYHQAFDVAEKSAFYEFADKVIAHYGRVDLVINNAGVAIFKLTASEVSIADYEWIMGINLWGMMYGSLAFLPHLRKQKESAIVNISSIFGILGFPNQAAYCTTKFAIRGFTESLAIEERVLKTGVTVTSVHPGGIKTNIARHARYAGNDENAIKQVERLFVTTPEKAAKAIIAGIKRKKMRLIVGPDAKMLYFLTRLSPKFVAWYLIRFANQWK